ncbi:MAG: hypothetical protein WBJ48_06985, partial [Bacteroidales bacterium]
MENKIPESIILAIGLLLLGSMIKGGIKVFSERDRMVSVKGLSEMEVQANRVIWPLLFKEVGNDLL